MRLARQVLFVFLLVTLAIPPRTTNAQTGNTATISASEVEVLLPSGWNISFAGGQSVGIANATTVRANGEQITQTRVGAAESFLTFVGLQPQRNLQTSATSAARSLTNFLAGRSRTETIDGVAVAVVELTPLSGGRGITSAVYLIGDGEGAFLTIFFSGSPAQYTNDKDTAIRVAASVKPARASEVLKETVNVRPTPNATLLSQEVSGTGWKMRLPATFKPLTSLSEMGEMASLSNLLGYGAYVGPSSYPNSTLVIFVIPSSAPAVGVRFSLVQAFADMSGGLGYNRGPVLQRNLNGRLAAVMEEGTFFTVSLMGVAVKTDNDDVNSLVVWLSGDVPPKPFTAKEQEIIYSIAASVESTRTVRPAAETASGGGESGSGGGTSSGASVESTPIAYGEEMTVTIPAQTSIYLRFSGKKGDVAFARGKVDDAVVSLGLYRESMRILDDSAPYAPYQNTSVVLPEDGVYLIKVQNFMRREVKIPLSLTQLIPDEGVTTGGVLSLEQPVTKYIGAYEEDSWQYVARAGETLYVAFNGVGTLNFRAQSGQYIGQHFGFKFAEAPYKIVVKTNTTIQIGIKSASAQLYTLKLSAAETVTAETGQVSETPPSSPAERGGESSALVPPATPIVNPDERGGESSSISPTAQPAAINCPGSLPSRLIVGGEAHVLPGESNNLRSGAGRNFRVLLAIPAGGVMRVLDGPTCAGGFAWWRVNYRGTIGWTVESGDGVYWVESLR
ncbi:MAG TPA: SH3 domain-containing protein [Aggregatilineales bacterium]|nr:hypothetical protein [Anaerolineales bacterium]HRE48542.1 SH3 domain-containing protein [Aggregatilineales bacterium]